MISQMRACKAGPVYNLQRSDGRRLAFIINFGCVVLIYKNNNSIEL